MSAADREALLRKVAQKASSDRQVTIKASSITERVTVRHLVEAPLLADGHGQPFRPRSVEVQWQRVCSGYGAAPWVCVVCVSGLYEEELRGSGRRVFEAGVDELPAWLRFVIEAHDPRREKGQ